MGEPTESADANIHIAISHPPDRPILADTLRVLASLQLHLQVMAEPTDDTEEWLDAAALTAPEQPPFSTLLQRLRGSQIALNPRAAAAALLLRFGWSAGFAATAYLSRARVPFVRDYALLFSPRTLLKALWLRDVQFIGAPDDPLAGGAEWLGAASRPELRAHLLESLIAVAEPVVASLHDWSRFSRHALWAMVTSSWAAQFANVGRQLGDERRGVGEISAVLDMVPEIRRAAPELYEVQSEGLTRTCQKLRSCCLFYKSSGRRFCANCPIVPAAERLEKNRAWVAAQAG
jgi:FhuF 2Fe-2S C-terminal domain